MRLVIVLSVAFISTAPLVAFAGCPEHSHVKPGTENLRVVICNCDDGYENRGGRCLPVPSMRQDSPQQQLQRLGDEARSEWYWFTVNHFDVMTAAFWAAYGYNPKAAKGEDPAVDSMWREARERLGKWVEVQRRIEAITHDSEIARQRYEERVRNFTVARKGSYAVAVSPDTAKADMYPPTDFSPWAKDDEARKNGRCIFVGRSAELVCK